MNLRLKIFMLFVLVSVLVPIRGGTQEKIKKMEPKKETMMPLSIFRDIEKAWHNESPDEILNLLSKGKVYLYIKESGYREGYYSHSQTRYIFRSIFEQNRQLKFRFVKYYNLEQPSRRVYGVAQRSYKNISSGRLFRDKLYVALKREGDRWVIARIKSNW